MLCPPHGFTGKFLRYLLFIAFLMPAHALFAQDVTPESCSEGLPEARNQLFLGDFEQAIASIRPCLDANAYTNTDDLVQAYELLANVYIAINEEDQARESIAELLAVSPDYEPDPDQSRSDYVLLINEMRAQQAPAAPAITAITSGQLLTTLTWTFDASPVVSSFTLYRGTHPDSLAERAQLSAAELTVSTAPNGLLQASFDDLEVDYETTYHYALEAVGENGNASPRSSLATILTPAQPQLTESETPGRKRKGISPWVFVGGGVVAGGLVAVLAGGGGGGGGDPTEGGPQTLIGPPTLP